MPFERSIKCASDIIREAKSLVPVLMVGPTPVADTSRHAGIKMLSTEFGAICDAEDVPSLDVFDRLAESPAWMTKVGAVDGAHPGAAGYAMLAGLVGSWSAWRRWFQ